MHLLMWYFSVVVCGGALRPFLEWSGGAPFLEWSGGAPFLEWSGGAPFLEWRCTLRPFLKAEGAGAWHNIIV